MAKKLPHINPDLSDSPRSVLCYNCHEVIHSSDAVCPNCGAGNYDGDAYYDKKRIDAIRDKIQNITPDVEEETQVIEVTPGKLAAIIIGVIAAAALVVGKIIGWV